MRNKIILRVNICILFLNTFAIFSAFLAESVPDQVTIDASSFLYVDFVVSSIDSRMRWGIWYKHDREWFQSWEPHWKSFHPGKVRAQKQPIIPKFIHQIWLGSPVPEGYKQWRDSWKKHHPGWIYKLWTDEDVKSLNLKNRTLYDAATNYGVKGDILQLELLDQFGGLYIDTDFECLKPFDELHHKYSFYTGINNCYTVGLATGLVASTPQHPIVRECIEQLGKHAKLYDPVGGVGPGLFTRTVMNFFNFNDPLLMVFPPNYFYPLSGLDKHSTVAIERAYQKPEVYAFHHWEGAWAKPKANVRR